MRHLPFVHALAAVKDTSDPVWRDASAGYLVLRFFDRWLDEGPALMSFDQALPTLKARIESTEDAHPQVRELLLTAVQTMIDAPGTNPSSVVGPLLAYGKYLEMAGRLELAAHVYQTMIDALDPPSGCADPGAAFEAFMQYAFVTRLLGNFDASSDAYQRAAMLAEQTGTLLLALRARVGVANTLRARGNLGEAESVLDQIIAEATHANLTRAISWGLRVRGAVRKLRGRHTEAMTDYFRAHELTDDPTERETILGDLAACAADAGYRKLAFDAHRVLAYTARLPIVRSAALGNLLELAALEGNVNEFERLRTHIQTHARQHALSAEHATYIALYTAYGLERFGSRDEAIATYRAVITQANTLGLHQIAFQAEECLTALMTSGKVAHDDLLICELPDSLRHIAATIAEWGTLAASTI
jgi:tetratricopeptide (TPR) repeat protein